MHVSLLHSLVYQAALAMTPIAGGLALIKGGKPERYGAAFFLAVLLSSDVYAFVAQRLGYWAWDSLAHVDMVSTFAISSFFLYLAVRYASLWLAAAMVVQGTELYFARSYIDEGKSGLYNYGFELNIICLAVLSLLLTAAILSWQGRIAARKAEQKRVELTDRRREEQQRRFEAMLAERPKPAPAPKPAPGRVARLIIEPPPV
jgi:hypothetical protein